MSEILLLGPDRARAGGLKTLLRQDGHDVRWVKNVSDWASIERDILPELVVAAVDSTESILAADTLACRRFPAPLLFIQNEADFGNDFYLEDRLVDRLESPFMSEDLLARIDALVRVRQVILRILPTAREVADGAGKERIANQSSLRRLGHRMAAMLSSSGHTFDKPSGPYREVAARVADWSDHRDGFEPGHAGRVAGFCAMIAEGMDLPDHEVSALLRAAMLHDIGKVSIPVDLLQRKGPLGDDQMRLMKTHPKRGAALLRALDRDEDVARIILYHHEKLDGSGYYGRRSDKVPVTSRILAVAETYDAMTHSMVRQTVDSKTALQQLTADDGRLYDGECVEALAMALTPRRKTIPLSPEFSW